MTDASIQKLIEAVESADSADRLTDAMRDLAEARSPSPQKNRPRLPGRIAIALLL